MNAKGRRNAKHRAPSSGIENEKWGGIEMLPSISNFLGGKKNDTIRRPHFSETSTRTGAHSIKMCVCKLQLLRCICICSKTGWVIFKAWLSAILFGISVFFKLFSKQRDFMAISGQLGTTKDMIVKNQYSCLFVALRAYLLVWAAADSWRSNHRLGWALFVLACKSN